MLKHPGPDLGRAARRAWEAFVTGEEPDLGHLCPPLRTSWARSRRRGINPQLPCAPVDAVDESDLRQEVPWLGAADPAFALLCAALSEPHQLAMLSDATGRILHCHTGEKARARAAELNVVVGSNWGEGQVGCTAIGACLHDGVPVRANWCESYSCNWHDWVNQAVPVRDPVTRRVIGGINVAGFREIIHPGVLDLALRTASIIELAIEQQDWRLRAELLERFQRLRGRCASDACFAVDRRGRLAAFNGAAERRLRLASRHLGADIGTLEPLAAMLAPENAEAGDIQRRAPPIAGAEVIDVGAERYNGGIYVVAPDKRARPSQAWPTRHTFSDLIGDSAAFTACVREARRAAAEDWPVLLAGESGTGKELLAHAIHAAGPRRQGPFVAFSCAGINDDLVAAELFGYCAGSFTGATKDGRIGKIEVAHHGTLFLDDVDCMPARMQASLLRVLEDQMVLPVGAVTPRRVDIRVIAATNADLERACAQGRFRHDLYHRLNVIALEIPPLRARAGDLALLVPHLLGRLGVCKAMSEEALRHLAKYAWPGNVRELRNILIRAAMSARGAVIECADLPGSVRSPRCSEQEPSAPVAALSVAEARERDELLRALESSASVVEAAAKLGIHFTSAYRRMRKYGIARR